MRRSRPTRPLAYLSRARPTCATRRHAKGEKGRTTLIRAGWKAGPGLMQRPGEAGGSRGAGSRADGESSPDDVAAGRYCQTPECAQARPKGRAKAKRWSKPLDRINGPEPGGCGLWCGQQRRRRVDWRPAPVPVHRSGPGGRRDAAIALRMRCRGKADCRPGQTDHGERGKRPERDRPLVAVGQARCPLMCAGRGGAVAVLRGRESRPHGEGRQQDRGMRSRSGGRA